MLVAIVKKDIIPRGDGNVPFLPKGVAAELVKKDITPKGDGNRTRLRVYPLILSGLR